MNSSARFSMLYRFAGAALPSVGIEASLRFADGRSARLGSIPSSRSLRAWLAASCAPLCEVSG